MFIFSSCTGMFINKYGYVSKDSKIIRKDGRAVFLPENAPSITQGFKPETEDNNGNEISGHEGIDIMSAKGTPVIAPAPGVVISSYYEPFYGNRLKIGHGRDENGLFIVTKFFHLSERKVQKGEQVVRGQRIGSLGSTGLLASYPHLHYEVRLGENEDMLRYEPMSPHLYWVDGVGNVTCFESNKKWPDKPFKTTFPVPCLGVDSE